MTEALTQETPGKVLALLCTALFSLGLMFSVTISDASFQGTQMPLPDPFAPQKVVSVIDKAAAAYSNFLAVNFLNPLAADYKIYADNLAWIYQESGLAYYLGLDNLNAPQQALGSSSAAEGQVAGAFVKKAPQSAQSDWSDLNMDTLYSILIR
jgi:hypothetical protein